MLAMKSKTTIKPTINEFLKLFRELDYSLRTDEKFKKFVDIAFAFYQMPFVPNGKKLYSDVFNSVREQDQLIYSQMFEIMIDAMEAEHQDFLGQAFMQLELGNAYKGQFFTPYCVCKMMARMVGTNDTQNIKERGYITVNEPAAGAGANIIAYAEALIEAGINPARHMYVVAQDVDLLAAKMCFVQLSAYGIAAEVIHGNTLTMETWATWYTPVFYIEAWPARMAVRTMVKWLREIEAPQPVPVDETPALVPITDSKAPEPSVLSTGFIQLNLFEETCQ